MGRHAVKFGGEYRAAYSNSSDNYASRTILDFSPFSNFGIPAVLGTQFFDQDPTLQNLVWMLLGGTDLQTQAQFFNNAAARTPTDLRGFRQTDVAGFGQVSYKLFSNVTFTYGLRYELFGVPTEVNNELSTLLASPSGPGPFTFSIVGDKPGQVPLYRTSWNGVEPRFAAAWDPFSNGKSSVRAGYGIYRSDIPVRK
jgi:outer membrane receptor protein involved in Fe transport